MRILSVCVAALGGARASAEDFPNKPIRILTGSAGASLDFMARLIAREISGPLGQPVVIDNRSPVVAAETVAKALPDGHTLILYGNPFWIGPLLQKLSYDPIRDFLPITLAGVTPNIIVVHPSLPVRSVKELIALAKVKPGVLNYAASGMGGAGHLATELFKSMAGVRIEHINYKTTAQAINDLVGGQEQLLMFCPGVAAAPHIPTGRLRALAVTTAQSSTLFPDLPTVAASLPGYESSLIVGIFAPARTPATISGRLNQEIVRVLLTAEMKEKFRGSGSEVIASSPEQLAATVKSEIYTLGKMIRDLNIRAE